MFDLKDYGVYFHDPERQQGTRKQMSKYINQAGGKVCLNVSLATVGSSKSKVLASKSKANLIVCDLALMKEVIHMFAYWKQDVLAQR